MAGELKILITGAGGMLGSSLMKHFSWHNVDRFDGDITDAEQVMRELSNKKPDIIIHAAAFTDVDGCESNPDKAYLVNTVATSYLVDYCIKQQASLVYLSSTGVYGNNKKQAYTEFDAVNPTTVHHKSKYEAEKIITSHLSKFLIIRTGWLYGGSKDQSKNFVYKRFLEAKKAGILYSDNTQIGNPTYIQDLEKQIELLINKQVYGVFNCVNTAKNISRLAYVQAIVEYFGVECLVKTANKSMFKRLAPVSANESAINHKLDLMNLNIMGDWRTSLAAYIQTLK